MAKARLSGAQRRRIDRQRVAEQAAAGIAVVPGLPRLEPLESVRSYRVEVNNLYRALRRGVIPPEVASRGVWILNIGAALARAEEELLHQRDAIEALMRVGTLQASPMQQLAELAGPSEVTEIEEVPQ